MASPPVVSKRLSLERTAVADVEVALLVQEQSQGVPMIEQHHVGISMCLLVHFTRLEEVISSALTSSCALSLPLIISSARPVPANLGALRPASTTYLVNCVELTFLDGALHGGLRQLLDDFDQHWAPIVARLEDVRVFMDDQYLPPGGDPWLWSLLRLAYLRSHEPNGPAWAALAKRLTRDADALLEGVAANDPYHGDAPASLEQMRAVTELQPARRVAAFIAKFQSAQ